MRGRYESRVVPRKDFFVPVIFSRDVFILYFLPLAKEGANKTKRKRGKDYEKEIIANAAMNDKKRRSNSLNIVLVKDIGEGYIYKTECDKFGDFLKGAE